MCVCVCVFVCVCVCVCACVFGERRKKRKRERNCVPIVCMHPNFFKRAISPTSKVALTVLPFGALLYHTFKAYVGKSKVRKTYFEHTLAITH